MIPIKTFPQLTTERLILRPLRSTDAEDVYALRNDENVNSYVQVLASRKEETGMSVINRMEQEFFADKSYYWVISLKTDLKLIGNICLWNFSIDLKKAELGYSLFEPFRGKGFASEALETVIDFVFKNTEFEIIEAYTRYQNTSSTQLLKKFGFNIDESRKDPVDEKNLIFVKHKYP